MQIPSHDVAPARGREVSGCKQRTPSGSTKHGNVMTLPCLIPEREKLAETLNTIYLLNETEDTDARRRTLTVAAPSTARPSSPAPPRLRQRRVAGEQQQHVVGVHHALAHGRRAAVRHRVRTPDAVPRRAELLVQPEHLRAQTMMIS